MKEVAFAVSTGLTAVYCVVELALAISLGSLALMADAFHNVSDVVSVRARRRKAAILVCIVLSLFSCRLVLHGTHIA
jgi:hypothetical protein